MESDAHLDALANACYWFERFASSKDEYGRAHTFTELSNAMSDLATFHPLYDMNTGLIKEIDVRA